MVQPLVLAASMKAMEHLKRLLKHITGQPVAGSDSQAAFLFGGSGSSILSWLFDLTTRLWFQIFLFSSLPGEMIQFDYIIFFKWVETTNWTTIGVPFFVIKL